jgi:formylmethanofuran dehydrogenase subunit D
MKVAVISPHGRVVFTAKVGDRVHPETVVIPHGWATANANLLTDAEVLDPISGFPGFRSGVCRVEAG